VSRVQDLAAPRRGAMGDAPGLVSAITVWTPILPGHEEELDRYLESLPDGVDSPAARIEWTHLARWLIVPQLVFQGPPMKVDSLHSAYLVFTAAFDGGKDDYVEALRTRLAAECDAIWGHCVAYPGAGDPEAFRRYLQHNELRNRLFVSTYPDATVAEIRAGLELKRRLLAFAVRAQAMEAEELQQTFLELFGGEAA
jgi:hypothetical protein